jgi:hypothetical protein
MPEERNGLFSFGKSTISNLSTLPRYKLPKITANSLAEFQKKAGVFCQIVCQMAFGTNSKRLSCVLVVKIITIFCYPHQSVFFDLWVLAGYKSNLDRDTARAVTFLNGRNQRFWVSIFHSYKNPERYVGNGDSCERFPILPKQQRQG